LEKREVGEQRDHAGVLALIGLSAMYLAGIARVLHRKKPREQSNIELILYQASET
jgi:hypothetical protein